MPSLCRFPSQASIASHMENLSSFHGILFVTTSLVAQNVVQTYTAPPLGIFTSTTLSSTSTAFYLWLCSLSPLWASLISLTAEDCEWSLPRRIKVHHSLY